MVKTMNIRRVITRRHFLYLSGLAVTGVVATACGGEAPPGQTPTQPSPQAAATTGAASTATPQPTAAGAQPTAAGPARPASFKEAPQLAELVTQGKLPPVAERLPKAPLVVPPNDRVGRYGGTWRTALLNQADSPWIDRMLAYENLVRYDPGWQELLPNVAASFQAGPDAKEFTFKLREGLKWSDGQPYTADDVLFWWEDVILNKDLSPGGAPALMKPGGKVGAVTKVDQFTVKFTFEQPNGLFLQNLAGESGPTRHPKHYLRQFHVKHNPQGVEQLAQENGAEGWVKLFQAKGTAIPGTPVDARWNNKDLPLLYAWTLTTNFSSGGTRLVAERNPYYWKIDPAGNQLPYLDRVTYEIIPNIQVMVLKGANGEIDMQDRNFSTLLSEKTIFVDNQQRGNYRFFEIVFANMNTMIINLNLTHKDPVKRQIIGNKDFRIGLSHAIDRQEIIDVVYVGQGEPWQAAPRRQVPFYSERLAKQYTEYDVRKANEFLDKVAPQRDGQGFRLGPDGKRISIQIEVDTTQTPRVDALNLIKGHWQKVGVELTVKPEDRALMFTRAGANEHDGLAWAGGGGLQDALTTMGLYFPTGGDSHYAVPWGLWYNPGGTPRAQPEEPPEPVKQQMQLYRQLTTTGDRAGQIALAKQILEIAADQFYCLGISLLAPGFGIVKNNFHNVPKSMFGAGGIYDNPAPTNPCQYFIQ